MKNIARILIQHGMGMALDFERPQALVTMLNEARIYDMAIPVPETSAELDMYRKVMRDPRLVPHVQESLRIITSVYDPGGI